jgi:tRNA 2-thiouridine synthesizing protein C
MIRKKILFISRHAPYGSSIAKEALDALLAASAYEQSLSVLFMDDGIFQLLQHQQAEEINQKNFSSMLNALTLYDINSIYVHTESLTKRKITINELNIDIDSVQLIDGTAIGSLLAQQDQLLSF